MRLAEIDGQDWSSCRFGSKMQADEGKGMIILERNRQIGGSRCTPGA